MGFYWAIGARKRGLKGLMVVCEPVEIAAYVARWEGEVTLKVKPNLPSYLQNTALDPLEFTEIHYLFFSTKQGDSVVAELERASVFVGPKVDYEENDSGDFSLLLHYKIKRTLALSGEDSPALESFSSQQRMLTSEDQLIRMLDEDKYEGMWVDRPSLCLTKSEAVSALAKEYDVSEDQVWITIDGK
ncbi:hypothetical protein ACLPHM_04995 [Paenalcaligenes sp. Me131]|uniref:hypothetical protein n=1 Tax=Paenalcaligenes sp. Me131 TaxID=3392636 RepID=UPI003D2BE618